VAGSFLGFKHSEETKLGFAPPPVVLKKTFFNKAARAALLSFANLGIDHPLYGK
jgi:hypothetical protein